MGGRVMPCTAIVLAERCYYGVRYNSHFLFGAAVRTRKNTLTSRKQIGSSFSRPGESTATGTRNLTEIDVYIRVGITSAGWTFSRPFRRESNAAAREDAPRSRSAAWRGPGELEAFFRGCSKYLTARGRKSEGSYFQPYYIYLLL